MPSRLDYGQARRITFSGNIAKLLGPDEDVISYAFVARGFAAFANKTIRTALEEKGLSDLLPGDPIEILPFQRPNPASSHPFCFDDEQTRYVEAVRWRVGAILGWQQIDRRIDE